jgi:crotonobetainyl-CoA:carnitine CoA-transferase CaiB-like acyl-CoA transferase
MSKALDGVRILDFTHVQSGPTCPHLLAGFGAEVIKVERPGAGDDTRAWGPPFLKDKNGENSKESGYYLGVNRGKKSITVDISKPRGQDIIKALAKDADIILENYKVGTLGRYQLDYDSIRKINEKIIYCSITGFGQTGPKSNQLAYDFLIQAMGGLMSVTGEKDQNPGGGPQKVGIPIIDLITGSYATIGILAALASREVTGQGEYIDMSMLDVQVGLLSNQAMNYLMTGKTPLRNGNAHPNIQPQDVFKCSDGQIVLAVGNDSQFEKLCEALELTELCNDQRFKTNAQRIKNLLELRSLLDQAFIKNSRSYWTQKMQDAEVPCGPINSIAEALNDPQIVHRQMVRELDHPISGKVPQVMTPFHFTNSSIKVDQAPPLLGQHTLSILSDLGLSDDEIQKLKDDCVI